ncbi:MAG: hypothetical protein R3336_01735 [Phycisphaeraceae bacterium]|nr:hypothetical protein [Phycisphaeraceae bacterium]
MSHPRLLSRWLLPIVLLAATATGCSGPRATRTTTLNDWTDRAWQQALEQPVPPGNVRVVVDRYVLEEKRLAAVRVAMRHDDPTIKVGGATDAHSNGLNVFVARSGLTARIRAEMSQQQQRRAQRQMLLTVPGYTATVQAVRYEAEPRTLLLPVFRGVVLVRTLQQRVTGTGLAVTVHGAAGGMVYLSLKPWVRRRDDGKAIFIEELTTRVRVPAGRPVVVMARRDQPTSIGWQLFSWQETSGIHEVMMVVRAQLPE